MNTSDNFNTEDCEQLYKVRLSEAAEIIYRDLHGTKAFFKIKKIIETLDTVPEIGRVYDPNYPAARPPFEMRVTYAGRYGIYYIVEEEECLVRIMFIEDQRRDPLNRFYGIYPHEAK